MLSKKPFRSGLVVGKFSPLHNGHVSLINAALERVDKLTIITYSNTHMDEVCSRMEVEYWLRCATMSEQSRVTIIAPETRRCPFNEYPAYDHREFCARLLYEAGIVIDSVFSNEEYGEGLAQHIEDFQVAVYGGAHTPKVTGITFDKQRDNIPISATKIRTEGVLNTREWVPQYVAASYIPRIVFMGGESSGKTTTAKALTSAINLRKGFEARYVAEYGRTLYEKLDGNMWYSDFKDLVSEQVKHERTAANYLAYTGADLHKSFVICDTNTLTTEWYVEQWFKNLRSYVQGMEELARTRKYSLYVICDPEIPFDQDGTRADEHFREAHYGWLRDRLRGRPQLRVTGSTEDRVEQILQYMRENMNAKELW